MPSLSCFSEKGGFCRDLNSYHCLMPFEEKLGTCTCYVSPDFLDHAKGVVQSLIGFMQEKPMGKSC